jgi:hypothetical protein
MKNGLELASRHLGLRDERAWANTAGTIGTGMSGIEKGCLISSVHYADSEILWAK